MLYRFHLAVRFRRIQCRYRFFLQTLTTALCAFNITPQYDHRMLSKLCLKLTGCSDDMERRGLLGDRRTRTPSS